MDGDRPTLLVGAQVRLRRSTPADAHVLHLLARDPDVARYTAWPRQADRGEAVAFLARAALGWETGRELHWMIERLQDGEPVGCIGCRLQCASADFDVLLAPHAWGRGLATDACAALLAWLRSVGIARIWATADPDDPRSAPMLERAGLAREGVLHAARRRPNLGGPPRDTVVYAWCLDETC